MLERQVIDAVVDTVNAVLKISATDIESAPKFGAKIRTYFIAGNVMVNDSFVTLLNIDNVLSMLKLDALAGLGSFV